jgi:glycosyltransferase involved in cell wall biosynthesis
MWQRTLCQVSFAVTSVLLALTKPVRPDVVIVSSPPFFTVPAGWAFSRYHRAPLVFEVRDLWPDVFVASGVLSEGRLFRALRRLEMAFYRAARKVVVVTRSFRDDLLARGVPEEKISVVPNGADLELFGPRPASADLRRRLGGEGKFLATYVGTHGILQGLEQILDAAEDLREEPRFVFAFVGEGARREALGEDAARRRLDGVTFHAALPRETMPELYASSDACIVCLRPLPIFRKFVPSKIFEILACGRPLIAAVEGEAAEIVRAAGGIVVPPGDGKAIAGALRELAREGTATAGETEPPGRRYVREKFDRRRLAREYLETLRAAAAENPTPGPLSGR